MEEEAVAPVVQAEAPARDQVTAATDAAVRPAAVRHEVVVPSSGRWTLDSSVEDVFMEDCGGLDDMRLHDFLFEHFGEAFGSPSVSMRVFMDDPTLFVTDESVLVKITNSSPYVEFVRKYGLHKAMREGVSRLHTKWIFTLRRWAGAAAANEVEDVDASLKVKLNAALFIARRNERPVGISIAPTAEKIDTVYDSVFNARWSYVVMGKEYGEGTLGVGVLDATSGEQPHLWSEVQADVPYDPEEPWEGDEVPGVEGKLVMAVLSSVKGWPYASFSENKIRKEKMRLLGGHSTECDAYIRRSNWRVWNIVKECLDEWVEGRRGGYPHNFTVNGTLGIGKSFATGSLLLYQLLHYPSEWLKVVAYFVRGKAYIFHREDRRVVYYKKEEVAVDEIEEMVSKGVEGYIIYDMCGGRDSIHSLPDKWGVVLLTYAKSSNYERWSEERYGGTSPIYVDCYDDVEFMAVLTWERHMQGPDGLTPMNRTGNILEDWEMLRNRIYKVGPVPRYVLKGEVTFNSRACTVNNSVKRLSYADLDDFMWRLKNVTEWPINDARYEMVIQIRTSGHITDDCTSHIISSYVWQELLLIILRHFCETEVQESELHSGGERCARTRETLGVTVFLIRSVSDVMVRHLKHLPREGETERSCTSVLARVSAWGRVPSRTSFLAKEDRDLSLQSDKLYRPLFQNFPVVDGFFLVDAVGERVGVSLPEGAAAPTQTIVLIQVTRARDHHTTTSKVEAFRKRMAKYFTNWTEMESRLSYEIIYVQHADSTTLTGRQRCARSGVANDAGNERFWSGIHQFCVKLDAPIAKLLFKDIYGAELIEEAGAPVATETRIKRRRVEDVAATV